MSAKNFRLPPLPRFRVKSANKQQVHPCNLVMSSVLGCWASQGHATKGCEAFEQALRTCMDTNKRVKSQKSTLNYHMARLYPKIVGPQKPHM
ncbi:mitochondrial 37S ribosomal protein mS37 [Arthrobotrys flagrans]|uniref:Small ribosomal subunit protein mS37 n=1 Tax=Arthrobotrys flagrans TaxID=97331 RepID=A0A436ZPW5_ARTFL|nr:hypothetical protein DFL_008825 [Arthrobotrys flagrans]